VDLTFGMLGDETHKPDLARLTPLPSSSDPIVIFMGVLRDGRTAVFMITADATPRPGDRCHESQGHIAAVENCSYVYLKAGETETFEVNDGLGIAQYRLHINHVRKTDVATAAKAARANARESRAGREILRMEIPELGTLRYSRATGTLYRIHG
jgi:hypothetical protein